VPDCLILGRPPRWVPLALTAVGLASLGVYAQKAPAVPDVLRAAADYLVQYSQRLSAIAAEEDYTQYDVSSGQMSVPRRLSADVVMIGLGDGGVVGFRDVFAIDSNPVRPREDRLLTLFRTPPSSPLQQARQLSDDSVRYYLNRNISALDQPTIALAFLRRENQERCTFKLESVKTMSGAQVAILKFTERSTPRIVPTPGDGPAVGRFWIDVASGTIRQTELGITTKTFNVLATVKYATEPKLELWLPVEMSQHNEVTGPGSGAPGNMGAGGDYSTHQAVEARANYAKFRQVPVDLSKVK
jgi:hypothetical protein